jgi:hypothetical protein
MLQIVSILMHVYSIYVNTGFTIFIIVSTFYVQYIGIFVFITKFYFLASKRGELKVHIRYRYRIYTVSIMYFWKYKGSILKVEKWILLKQNIYDQISRY